MVSAFENSLFGGKDRCSGLSAKRYRLEYMRAERREGTEQDLETEVVMVMMMQMFSSAYKVHHVDIKQRNSPSGDLARRKAKKKVWVLNGDSGSWSEKQQKNCVEEITGTWQEALHLGIRGYLIWPQLSLRCCPSAGGL